MNKLVYSFLCERRIGLNRDAIRDQLGQNMVQVRIECVVPPKDVWDRIGHPEGRRFAEGAVFNLEAV